MNLLKLELDFYKRRLKNYKDGIALFQEAIKGSKAIIAECDKELETASDEVKKGILAEKEHYIKVANDARKNIKYLTKKIEETQKEIKRLEKLVKKLA